MSHATRHAPVIDLNEAPSASSSAERRAEPRRPSFYMAFIRAHRMPQAAYQPGTVWDVSATGISLFLDQALEPGELLDVTFRHVGIRDRTAAVIHVTPQGQGWRVGCKLNQPLSPQELHALGG